MVAPDIFSDLKLQLCDNHGRRIQKEGCGVDPLLSDVTVIHVRVPNVIPGCSGMESRKLLKIWGLALLTKVWCFSLLSLFVFICCPCLHSRYILGGKNKSVMEKKPP